MGLIACKDDKDLTFLLASCANIGNHFVDLMTRLHQRGPSRPGTEIGNRILNQLRFATIFVGILLLLSSPGFPQNIDVEDVHVVFRGKQFKPALP